MVAQKIGTIFEVGKVVESPFEVGKVVGIRVVYHCKNGQSLCEYKPTRFRIFFQLTLKRKEFMATSFGSSKVSSFVPVLPVAPTI